MTRASPRPWRFGEGRISGACSIGLGALSLFAVLCFHFPEQLTMPELRAIYPIAWVRATLFVALLLAILFGLMSVVLQDRTRTGMTGIALAGIAILLGGAWVETPDEIESGLYLGLDWFVLNLLVLALIFVPLEKMKPLYADQPVVRRGFRTDLMHFFVSHLLVQATVFLTMAPAAWILRGFIDPAFQSAVANQPIALQVLEAIVLADLFQYSIHRAFHQFPFLWRFHAIHHSSTQMDWLAGSRLHLVDIVVTRAFAFLPLYAMGFDEGALRTYLAIVAFHAVFDHANVAFDFGWLRWWIATPQFHHWHHTAEEHALDKNFAAQVPAIDWLFGTAHQPGQWPTRYGLHDTEPPEGWWAQFKAPFQRSRVGPMK